MFKIKFLYCSLSGCYIFGLFIIFLLDISCHKKVEQTKNVTLLISDTFPNRIIDDSSKHDKDCFGFYNHHFSPSVLDTNYFCMEEIESLNKKTRIKWHVLSVNDSLIDFCKIFSDNKNKVVYVAEIIETDSAETKIISIGSDDVFILWVNGDSITSTHKVRSLHPHDDLLTVNLRTGKNVFLYKVEQSNQAWKLYRKFISKRRLESILLFNITDLYGDIPESCILPDTVNSIKLKQNNNRKLDSLHVVQFCWRRIENGKYYAQEISYPAAKLPAELPLPDNFAGKAMFEIQVINKVGRIDFREEIPIFFEREADRLAKSLTDAAKDSDNPVEISRRNAVLELLRLDQYRNNNTEYSTRTKAHALVDLYCSLVCRKNSHRIFSGPQVWGYRSLKDISVQTYRVFIPASLSNQLDISNGYPIVFILRYELKKDYGFWQTRHGKSHYNMKKRSALSTQYQTIIVMPHGRGIQNYLGDSIEEIPLILEQLKENFPIDTTNISLFALSKGAHLMLKLMMVQKLPISSVGFRSPKLSENESNINHILFKLKRDYPELKWFIRHGVDDEVVPISISRKWVELIQKIPFEIDYREERYTGHSGYFVNPEKQFCHKIRNL